MEDRWAKLEEIVRRVVREEVAALKKTKRGKIKFENGRWQIGEEEMTLFRETYPAVDVTQQLKEMAVWIVTHPDDAPSSNGYGAFIARWLKSHQNQASLKSIPTNRPTAVAPSLCEYCMASSIGAIGGRRHCRAHAQNAMDGEQPPKFMPGIQPKQVAGRD